MMQLVVLVAFVVLVIVFVGSVIALALLCWRRRVAAAGGLTSDRSPILRFSRDDVNEDDCWPADVNSAEHGVVHIEVGDVGTLCPDIARLLNENEWVHDTSGLVQNCLSILKLCHDVTDKLSQAPPVPHLVNQELLVELREATKRVMPRVEQLMKTMYVSASSGETLPAAVGCSSSSSSTTYGGGMAGATAAAAQQTAEKARLAALLEARAAALVMAVASLASVFKAVHFSCPNSARLAAAAAVPPTADEHEPQQQQVAATPAGLMRTLDAEWLRRSVDLLEHHLHALHLAAESEEAALWKASGSVGVKHHHQQQQHCLDAVKEQDEVEEDTSLLDKTKTITGTETQRDEKEERRVDVVVHSSESQPNRTTTSSDGHNRSSVAA